MDKILIKYVNTQVKAIKQYIPVALLTRNVLIFFVQSSVHEVPKCDLFSDQGLIV